jgi:hypothetical protein
MLIIYQPKEVVGRLEMQRDGDCVAIGSGNRVMTLGGVSDRYLLRKGYWLHEL